MKNKTSMALTLPVIFAPMLYGVAMYSRLPSVLATHWGMQNQVNGTMSKPWFIFATPFLMALFQAVVILVPRKKATAPRFERMVIWIMPVITLVAYIATIQINLGHAWDIRRIAMLLVAAVMLAMGNYLPTISPDYQSYKLVMQHIAKRADAKRVYRRMGHVMVGFGILALISIFLPPIASVIVIAAMIVVMLIMPFI